MASLFSKIVAGEIPCHRIAENDDFLAFLDIMPLAEGHVLVVPKMEVDYFFDLDNHTLSSINIVRSRRRQTNRTSHPLQARRSCHHWIGGPSCTRAPHSAANGV